MFLDSHLVANNLFGVSEVEEVVPGGSMRVEVQNQLRGVESHLQRRVRIFIEPMTSDHKRKASTEGSN